MACLLTSGTRVLTSTGKRRDIDHLKCGDMVIDMHGTPRRITRLVKRDEVRDCHRIYVSRYPHPIDLLDDTNYVMTTQGWQHASKLCAHERLVIPERIHWSLPHDISFVRHSGTGSWTARFELGYVMGSKLACGYIDREQSPECITFLYDMAPSQHWQMLIDCVTALDPNANIHITQSETLRSIRVTSKDIFMLLATFDRTDGVPVDMLSTHPEFLKGIYEGVMHSNHMHINIAVFDLVAWCLPSKESLHPYVVKAERIVKKDIFEVETETPDAATTILTHHIVLASQTKEQQQKKEHLATPS